MDSENKLESIVFVGRKKSERIVVVVGIVGEDAFFDAFGGLDARCAFERFDFLPFFRIELFWDIHLHVDQQVAFAIAVGAGESFAR